MYQASNLENIQSNSPAAPVCIDPLLLLLFIFLGLFTHELRCHGYHIKTPTNGKIAMIAFALGLMGASILNHKTRGVN
jgi:hypothetical protein